MRSPCCGRWRLLHPLHHPVGASAAVFRQFSEPPNLVAKCEMKFQRPWRRSYCYVQVQPQLPLTPHVSKRPYESAPHVAHARVRSATQGATFPTDKLFEPVVGPQPQSLEPPDFSTLRSGGGGCVDA